MTTMHALRLFLEMVGGLAVVSMGITWLSLGLLARNINQKRVGRECHK